MTSDVVLKKGCKTPWGTTGPIQTQPPAQSLVTGPTPSILVLFLSRSLFNAHAYTCAGGGGGVCFTEARVSNSAEELKKTSQDEYPLAQ